MGTSCTPEAGYLPLVPSLCPMLGTERAQVGVGASHGSASGAAQMDTVAAGDRAPGFLRAVLWSREWPVLLAPGPMPTARSSGWVIS